MVTFKTAVKLSLAGIAFLLAGCTPIADRTLLPENQTTFNDYKQTPGCYVACYAHTGEGAAYQLSDGSFYVMGSFRVRGQYIKGMCTPAGTAWKQKAQQQTLCASHFPSCKTNECWIGGDTGGWVGASYG